MPRHDYLSSHVSTPFDQGRLDWLKAPPSLSMMSACPYPLGTVAAEQWANGWRAESRDMLAMISEITRH